MNVAIGSVTKDGHEKRNVVNAGNESDRESRAIEAGHQKAIEVCRDRDLDRQMGEPHPTMTTATNRTKTIELMSIKYIYPEPMHSYRSLLCDLFSCW